MTDSRSNESQGLALLATLGAGALAVSGCATPGGDFQPAAAEQRLALDGCNAQAAQTLVGAAATEAAGKEAQRLAGAETVRWIRPGDPVSQDYNTGRLNIETDGRRIARISCG
jgi:hypothetical protein